jgi:hypothetical protein
MNYPALKAKLDPQKISNTENPPLPAAKIHRETLFFRFFRPE